ncbi:M48 family metalloprotease [Pseudogulbenkiania sp. MAI-1]|uniref:M48 family metalloprotease n=1 Tax=Pseudogulbenkiania sp. MAI-1 TaxID=990370 RepID=UPI00045E9953|nr:M48 family metalloprotease [Pseudogulbenkiania sp. MAI-1]
MKTTLTAAVLALALSGTVSAQIDLPELGDASSASFSPSQEAAVGRDVMNRLRESGDVIDDADVAAYLQELGGRLAQAAQAPDLSFSFFAVNERSINAFAMPGGYIGVHSGLVLTTQSEAELASVLAHEIAHASQHHLARLKAASAPNQLWLLAALLAGALASRSGNSDAAFGAINAGIGLSISSQLAYSRDFEREADRLGMQYLAAAGFDARAMPTFFQRMQQGNRFNDNNALAFLRSHPVTGERISEAQDRALAFPLKMRADSTAYLLIREKLRLATLGRDEALRYYQTSLQNRQFLNEGAQWYGLSLARLAAGQPAAARTALAEARQRLPASPLLFVQQAAIERTERNWAAAQDTYRRGLAAFPGYGPLRYGELDTLLDSGQREAALARLRSQLGQHPGEPGLYRREAAIYADKDALRYHAALGQAFYYEQRYEAALEQFQYASQAPGEDFYLRSSIEARVRELQSRLKEERRPARK